MDKVYTKIILEKARIAQVKSEYIKKCGKKYVYVDKNFNEKECEIKEIINIMEENLKYPMFVKPSNSGSSVGVSKVKNNEELEKAIKYASEFDRKMLVEEGIVR
jgi:D-alanine-D-alanine ligase